MRWKRLPINAYDVVKLPRLSQREVRPLDQEQARRLILAAQGNRLASLLPVALTTGMRLGEILSLHWDDVNLEKRVLQVRYTVDYVPGLGRTQSAPKTDAGRRQLVLPQVTIEALKQQRARQLEARLAAGATWQEQGLVFANRNGGYFSRARLYANFATTMNIYGHVLPSMQRDAMTGLDGFFKGAGQGEQGL